MEHTLKTIEEMKLTNTEECIINFISKLDTDKTDLYTLSENVKVLYATLCKELKKLVLKGVLVVDGSDITLTDFGLRIQNYNKFKQKILNEFCVLNKIDINTLKCFVENKDYNNIKLLLGIKNLLNKDSR